MMSSKDDRTVYENEKSKAILNILNRLADYRDGEEAEAACLNEIYKNGDPRAWLILALIRLEERKFQSFGTCMRNATQHTTLEQLVSDLAEMTEYVSEFLDETYLPLSDFIDGYLGKEES